MRLLIGLCLLASCDGVFGVDPEPAGDAGVDGSANHGTPLFCTNLRSLPTIKEPSGAVGTFGTGTVFASPSAVRVGLQTLVTYLISDATTSPSLQWATVASPTTPLVARGFAQVSGTNASAATVWRDPDGELKMFARVAGVLTSATPETDGLDGRWVAGTPVTLPAGELRSIGVSGQRAIFEVDEPHALAEYARDPNTNELTLLDTLAIVNAAPNAPRHPSLSADGCRLMVELDTNEIAVSTRAPDGVFGAPTTLVTDAQPAHWPALSEDGDFIYFIRESEAVVRDDLFVFRR